MQRTRMFLAGMACLWAALPAFAADSGTPAIFTNKVRFRIPFHYDPAEMQRLQAREVQLYVSTDRGTRWRMVDKVEPRADHFDFLAPSDGEYWFAVRTLDAFSRLHPQGNSIEPALKVLVDATPPVLELLLTETEPGKIELRWTAADDHLDVTKLRIEYRQADSPEWQAAGVVPQPNGQTTWEVRAAGVVAVRGSISDQAGNTVTAERELNAHTAHRGPQKGSDTEYRAPVASASDPFKDIAAVRETATHPPNATSAASPNGAGTAPSAATTGKPSVSGVTPTLTASSNAPNSSAGGKITPDPMPSSDDTLNKSDSEFFAKGGNDPGPHIRPKTLPGDTTPDPSQALPPATPKSQSASTSPPQADAADGEDIKSSFAASPAPAKEAAPTKEQAASKEDEPRSILVNSCDFQIGYRVDDVGPSGVGKVELFITQDNGRKWYRYGTDPDNKSPFAVNVPADGVYGFELRVRNGAGLGDDPPHPGDKPSIVVTVDKTAPVAQLMPPQVGRGRSRNKVLLRWMAEDAHLGSTPILLEYAAEKSGPWQKIADWQANTGSYVWAIQPGFPGKVFVRLTVKDGAGNVTQLTAPDQLVIDFSRPTARIMDIEAKTPSEVHD